MSKHTNILAVSISIGIFAVILVGVLMILNRDKNNVSFTGGDVQEGQIRDLVGSQGGRLNADDHCPVLTQVTCQAGTTAIKSNFNSCSKTFTMACCGDGACTTNYESNSICAKDCKADGSSTGAASPASGTSLTGSPTVNDTPEIDY